MNDCSIDSCFDIELEEYKTLFEIENCPLTQLILEYCDFESVLYHAGTMRYNIELIAGVCGISEDEARRQLLQKELVSVLNYFDYWQSEEVKEQYIDIYRAYEKCLISEINPRE